MPVTCPLVQLLFIIPSLLPTVFGQSLHVAPGQSHISHLLHPSSSPLSTPPSLPFATLLSTPPSIYVTSCIPLLLSTPPTGHLHIPPTHRSSKYLAVRHSSGIPCSTRKSWIRILIAILGANSASARRSVVNGLTYAFRCWRRLAKYCSIACRS